MNWPNMVSNLVKKFFSFNLDKAIENNNKLRREGREKRDIIVTFNALRDEERLSDIFRKQIRLVSGEKPDGIFLEIGLVLDIWDLNMARWPISALRQVAHHYDVGHQEAIDNYEIVVTPFLNHHGKVWARRHLETIQTTA